MKGIKFVVINLIVLCGMQLQPLVQAATVTSTPTLTASPTASQTLTVTATVTSTNTITATSTPTGTATFTSTVTPTPTHTSTSSPTQTQTVTNTISPTITVTPTETVVALDHFHIIDSGTTTVGNTFTITIEAKTLSNSLISNYSGIVYVSCPDLDYTAPTESVMQITGAVPVYGANSTTAHWQCSGFSSGQLVLSVKVFRAAPIAPMAKIFVSDNPEDTPLSYSGHTGITTDFSVVTGSFDRVLALVPGQQYRPGGIDASGTSTFSGNGYSGNSNNFEVGQPVGVTVYATDQYWNIFSGSNDSFVVTTSPSHTDIHGQSFGFESGSRELNLTFLEANIYTLEIDSVTGGITDYNSPYQIVVTDDSTVTVTPTVTVTSTPRLMNETATPSVTQTIDPKIKQPDKKSPVVIRRNLIRPSKNEPVQFSLHLEKTQRVQIKIYNQRGRLIKTLADQAVDAGTFDAVWEGVNRNGSVVRSGIYIVHIKTEEFDEIRKLAVVR